MCTYTLYFNILALFYIKVYFSNKQGIILKKIQAIIISEFTKENKKIKQTIIINNNTLIIIIII